MNSKQFLTWGGALLALAAILGYVGILGPTPSQSFFGPSWWFDNTENVAHLILGIAGLTAALVLPTKRQRLLVYLFAILGLAIGTYNFFTTELLGANLEAPADLILNLAIGIWALVSALKGDQR